MCMESYCRQHTFSLPNPSQRYGDKRERAHAHAHTHTHTPPSKVQLL